MTPQAVIDAAYKGKTVVSTTHKGTEKVRISGGGWTTIPADYRGKIVATVGPLSAVGVCIKFTDGVQMILGTLEDLTVA